MTTHTKKNYPFLNKLKKDNWIVNNGDKHILIASFLEGRKQALLDVKKLIDEVLDLNEAKKMIYKLMKEKEIPIENAFKEKYFWHNLEYIKVELKEQINKLEINKL